MKAVYHLKNGITFEVEAETQADLFKKIVDLEEVFGETACGVCGSENIGMRIRDVDDNKYHEWVCRANGCGAKLEVHQHKKGGSLYIPRKNKETGKYDYKHRGWYKWQGQNSKGSEPEQEPEPATTSKKKGGKEVPF